MFKLLTVIFTFLFFLAAGVSEAKDVYFCPMHTFYTSDKPGDCPICGMKLVKKEPAREPDVKAGDSMKGHALVVADEAQVRAIGVTTAAVMKQPLVKTITASGTITTAYPITYRNYKTTSHANRNWGTIQVAVELFEQDLFYVEKGQEVQITIPESGTYKGTVRFVKRTVDPVTRTGQALVDMYDFRGEWAENMRVRAGIAVHLGEAVMVPVSAVIDTGGRKVVFVQPKPGVFEPRAVETGARGDNGWAVRQGLNEGEMVAAEGNFLLDSESRLKASIAGGSHD